jgi:plasmid maintenance system antidote protein VapI
MNRTLADILRARIVNSRQSINAIAVKSGISAPILYRFCNDKRDLTLSTATKLAVYFGLEMRPVATNKAKGAANISSKERH